mmetsp:Transcript_62575/g.148282  ORF Transcript_62575/g.148282 Transcript_62575/m.148282 type:complete len:96 (+) Transcript_62575:212-499(+)
MFKRPGDEHSVTHAYQNRQIADENLSIYIIWRSACWGFMDDIIFTFRTEGETTILKALSVSRVGIGDFGANQKHITELLGLVEGAKAVDVRVARS